MTSKERTRRAVLHEKPDRIPAAFEAVDSVTKRLLKHYGFSTYDQLMERYKVDIVATNPRYIGPPLKKYRSEKGEAVEASWWGFETTFHTTSIDTYGTTTYFPLDEVESLDDLNRYAYPDPDWFDYHSVAEICDRYPDKAIVIGHEGPFQFVTFLMSMDKFFMMMIDNPELSHEILDRMVKFELEYYRRTFEACKGRIDFLRPHDDYGTQISMLMSHDTWREFFYENTKKLVDLAHHYGAFYQQHSCGAVRPIIPDLIECGIDAIEPLQDIVGLERNKLQEDFGGKITFHGGIDTQKLLPHGSSQDVRKEAERLMHLFGKNGGYILMSSQAFEGDVPIENIEAVYDADRYVE